MREELDSFDEACTSSLKLHKKRTSQITDFWWLNYWCLNKYASPAERALKYILKEILKYEEVY